VTMECMDTTTTPLLDADEAAARLGVSRGAVQHLVRTKALEAIALPGGRIRIEPAALERFIATHRTTEGRGQR
jgi:excisionase family DNA binding protein